MSTIELGILECSHCAGRSFTIICDVRGMKWNGPIGQVHTNVTAPIDQLQCVKCGEEYIVLANGCPIKRR